MKKGKYTWVADKFKQLFSKLFRLDFFQGYINNLNNLPLLNNSFIKGKVIFSLLKVYKIIKTCLGQSTNTLSLYHKKNILSIYNSLGECKN